MFRFSFKGGVRNTQGTTDKFLLFLIIDGKEHSLYNMIQSSLVIPDEEQAVNAKVSSDAWARLARSKRKLISRHPHMKLMVQSVGVGSGGGKRQVFFYIRLMKNGGSKLHIKPWAEDTGFFFETEHAELIPYKDAAFMFPERSISRNMIERELRNPQGDAWKQLITTERNIRVNRKVRKIG